VRKARTAKGYRMRSFCKVPKYQVPSGTHDMLKCRNAVDHKLDTARTC
jgi:hypothetical protein